MRAWREDADTVFHGKCFSAETNAEQFAGHIGIEKKQIQRLAEDYPEKFTELVNKVSPFSQDILIQYYLLRRTQEQIGAVMELTQERVHYALTRAIKELKDGIVEGQRTGGKVVINRPKFLGASEVGIDEGTLALCFQPVNGAV